MKIWTRRRWDLGSAFGLVNALMLTIIGLLMIVPFLHIISASLTPIEDLVKTRFILIPTRISLEAYRYVFSTNVVLRGMIVSICVTVVGTIINIAMTALTAYPLAHKDLVGRKVMVGMVIFTMIFNGGIIPNYIIVRALGLTGSYWSLVLPVAIGSFNLMLFKNYFQELPMELEESAKLAGYNDLSILIRVILPVSMPLVATFVVMFGVSHWNSWFNASIYLSDSKMWPIQVILRQIITSASEVGDTAGAVNVVPPMTVRMCTIVVASLPILILYPFLQKYFVKGMMLGSVKG